MNESTWRTYGTDEINISYKGNDLILIIRLGEGEKSYMSRSTCQKVGGVVICGNTGATFDGVNYVKLINDSHINPEDDISFDERITQLEGLLLNHEMIPA